LPRRFPRAAILPLLLVRVFLLGVKLSRMEYAKRYISLGAGVQSSALLCLSNAEERGVPRADFALFADVGAEPPWVYRHLEALKEISDIPIYTCAAEGPTLDDVVKRTDGFIPIPAYTLDTRTDKRGILRRQCSREFKITPCAQWVRGHLGYQPRQRIKEKVQCLLGISIEEAMRMKPSRYPFIVNDYPLVDARIPRGECIDILKRHDWPMDDLAKSACTFCSYHDDAHWLKMKEGNEEERAAFEEACQVDEMIRNRTKAGAERPIFLHHSCKPLRSLDFSQEKNQLKFDFMQECDGICGV